MMVALRYIEKAGGYWEVQTEKEIERHTSLRQFEEQEKLAPLAKRAIQEPGIWVEVGQGKNDKK